VFWLSMEVALLNLDSVSSCKHHTCCTGKLYLLFEGYWPVHLHFVAADS
jgi:hypothetical protein